MSTPGRTLTDAMKRQAYKYADEFVNDLALNTPNEFHKTGPNDQNAYILERLSTILGILNVADVEIPGVMLFPQMIMLDTIVPRDYDGFTAARGVEPGVIVEVADGSRLTWIGDDPDVSEVRASNTIDITDYVGDLRLFQAMRGTGYRNTGGLSNINIPPMSLEDWAIGDSVTFYNDGTDKLIILAEVGVTLKGGINTLPIGSSVGMVQMTAPDEWTLIGGFA